MPTFGPLDFWTSQGKEPASFYQYGNTDLFRDGARVAAPASKKPKEPNARYSGKLHKPTELALIADYHTSRTRSLAVGWHQIAIYCGVIAGGFGGYVADAPTLGWRFAFDACGILGMLYAIPLVLLLPRHQSTSGSIKDSPVRAAGVSAVLVLLIRPREDASR